MANTTLTREEAGKIFGNHIMEDQITGDQFILDKNGEVRLKGNFLGEKNYVSLHDVVQDVKKFNKKVILNIGDSSTSGWNNEILSINEEIKQRKGGNFNPKTDIIFPIFTYKTYSDFIRNFVDHQFTVVNAGVPTHTSLNGLKRLKEVLSLFEKAGVKVDYITIYYGNNDSVSNANLEEKNRHGVIGRLRHLFGRKNSLMTRTTPTDYKKNMKKIVECCRNNGARPILIEPIIPIYWEPGKRIKRITIGHDNVDYFGCGKKVSELHVKSLHLWESGNEAYKKGSVEKAIALYNEAKEYDYIIPRIKQEHLQVLHDLAREEGVSIISIEIPRDKDDGSDGEGYFGDYCHPIEKSNELIAKEIVGIITKFEKINNSNVPDMPIDTYTLY